jgi:hypothetical protein
LLAGATHVSPTAPSVAVLVVASTLVGTPGAETGGGINGAVAVAVGESTLCVLAVSVTRLRARTTNVNDVFCVKPVTEKVRLVVCAALVVPRKVYVEPTLVYTLYDVTADPPESDTAPHDRFTCPVTVVLGVAVKVAGAVGDSR